MVRLSAVILVFFMLSQTFYNLGVVVYWFANHAYIATTQCENIDKPELECNGKCYLKKNLSAGPDAPKESKVPAPNFKKGADMPAFIPDQLVQLIPDIPVEHRVLIQAEPACQVEVLAAEIFHPPA